LIIAAAGLFGVMQIAHAPKIEGKWSGENWSNIDLHSAQEAGDWYAGSFEDAAGNRGAMKLEWSMLSGRFEGNWSVGPDRSGSIVLRRSAQFCSGEKRNPIERFSLETGR